MSSINMIFKYLEACYPALWIKTFEEERAIKDLTAIAKEQDFGLKAWTVTQGFLDLLYNENSESVTDPVSALEYIREDNENNCIYVLQNFQFYIEDNPEIIQRIKDLIPICKIKGKQIVFVSCRVTLPPEIEKEVTVVEYEFPDTSELERVLREVVKATLASSDEEELDESMNSIPNKKELLESALGLTCSEAENAFSLAYVTHKSFNADAIKTIQKEKANIIKKTGMLEYIPPTATIDDVGGFIVLKNWLKQRKKAFSPEAKAFGVPTPKGLFLTGVQGTGKTLCVKAVAGTWELPLLRFNIGEVFGSLVGQSEENMKKALKTAEAIAPCILWIDEIDKALAGIGSSGSTDSGVTSRVFGELLTWMQEKTKDVFVIATANNITHLPAELLRKGRFDELFFVDLPKAEERAEIFTIHLKKRNRNPENFDIAKLVEVSEGFGGAEIEQAIKDGLTSAFDEGVELTTEHIYQAIKETTPLSSTASDQIKAIQEWAKNRARNVSSDTKIKQSVEEKTVARRRLSSSTSA
jgi:ATP-dependent 26S proteasome regulatory subunit